jgi:hypothetical protein
MSSSINFVVFNEIKYNFDKKLIFQGKSNLVFFLNDRAFIQRFASKNV